MRVVINQSNYLPWRGYFDLINDADLFIFLDDVQYTHRDWRSRNRIKSPNGPLWLTIPVGSSTNRKINEVLIPAGDWVARHRESIRHAYARSPYFKAYEGIVGSLIEGHSGVSLSEFNQRAVRTLATEVLGITHTQFLNSADFKVTGAKQERILDLLKACGATTYISGPAAKDYIDPRRFADAGIELIWKDYTGYPAYPQPHAPFESAVSIVDLLFSVGPSAPWYIWGWRSGQPSPHISTHP